MDMNVATALREHRARLMADANVWVGELMVLAHTELENKVSTKARTKFEERKR